MNSYAGYGYDNYDRPNKVNLPDKAYKKKTDQSLFAACRLRVVAQAKGACSAQLRRQAPDIYSIIKIFLDPTPQNNRCHGY